MLLKSRGSITPEVNPDTPKVILISPKVILVINVLILLHYALELNLTLNTNDSIEGVKGKYYPRVEYKGTMSTLQLAKHMAEHTTSFTSKTK